MSDPIYKILVTDGLAKEAASMLQAHDAFELSLNKGVSAEQLHRIIPDFDAIIIRSATRIDEAVLDKTDRLKLIVRAGVGVDNVDLQAASRKGVIVMNTPGGNISSTAEHTMALILNLARQIPQTDDRIRRDTQAPLEDIQCHRLEGKTLGIIGLGRVGCGVAQRAGALGMRLLGYDPFIGEARAQSLQIKLADVNTIARQADIITVHTPMTPETRDIISTEQFQLMKPEAMLINCARGGIINENALLKALDENRISGAALDVYTEEPPGNTALTRHPRVVSTPHLGASTVEAQVAVGIEAAQQIMDALLHNRIRNAVNMPSADIHDMEQLRPFLVLAEHIGRIHSQLIHAPIQEVTVSYQGEMTSYPVSLVTRSLLVGILDPVLDHPVNRINAPLLADERGIKVNESTGGDPNPFINLITASVATEHGTRFLAGTVFGKNQPRIVSIDDCPVEVFLAGNILLMEVADRPGLLGKIGKLTGDAGINILAMTFGNSDTTNRGYTVLNLSSLPGQDTLQEISDIPGVTSCHIVNLEPAAT